ncbi:MAG: MATE family efflux transporter [Pseudomonadota bacterium]
MSPAVTTELRQLAKLSFPIMVSLGAATLIAAIDTIMISPLGTVPLAAAGITASVMIILYSALYGFVSATGVRMAEAEGKKDPDALSDATRTGLRMALFAGLAGTGLMLAARPLLPFIGQPPEVVAILGGYWTAMAALLVPFTLFYALKALFDAVGRPWIGVALAFAAVALNIPANLILIYGIGSWDGFGLLGAGLASLVSQTASLILAWLLWRRTIALARSRRPVPSSPDERRIQWREGATISLGYVGEGGAYAVASLMMGVFGAAALAANQIVGSVGGVLYMVPLGVSMAASIRVGQAVGADETDRLLPIGRAALTLIVGWMTLVMIALLLARVPLSNALSDDPEVIALAASLFLIAAAMQIADGVQGTMLGAARGLSDNRVPVAITLAAYWIVALPAAWLLGVTLGLGPNGVWIGYALGLGLAATLVSRRFFREAARRPGALAATA